MKNLFYIANQYALFLMKNEKEQQLFLAQRQTGWRGCIIAADVALDRKEETAKKMKSHERRRDRAQMGYEASTSRFRM